MYTLYDKVVISAISPPNRLGFRPDNNPHTSTWYGHAVSWLGRRGYAAWHPTESDTPNWIGSSLGSRHASTINWTLLERAHHGDSGYMLHSLTAKI